MDWAVEFHEEFEPEFDALPVEVQDEFYAEAQFIAMTGPATGRPHVDTLKGSSYPNMRELRFEAMNDEWRVAFAFDPKRVAVMLVGGGKVGTGEKRFYKALIKKADARYARHLERVMAEGKGKAMTTLHDKLQRLPAARRKKIDQRTAELVAEEMSMRELRKARNITQAELAKTLHIKQEQVSRIEKRTDLHIATLRRQVEALGGDLTIIATFPNRTPIKITGLGELEA